MHKFNHANKNKRKSTRQTAGASRKYPSSTFNHHLPHPLFPRTLIFNLTIQSSPPINSTPNRRRQISHKVPKYNKQQENSYK
mmetsp:Transcript_19853/g.45283  ORF Transcript_19853/g.45283 Transcript_19853/m.45283 type:complete len:82 (-) Transcript_19853:25-270(-)